MTRLLLVRHAQCDHVGHRLAGRMPGITLNEAGRAEAELLALRLARRNVAAIYASPLARAMETALIIAGVVRCTVQPLDALTEFDFGQWTGASIGALDAGDDDAWRRFNGNRGSTPADGGELQLEVQARAVRAVLDLATHHVDEPVLIVSHAEVLRSLLGHALGIPIDLQHRLQLAPASLSTIDVTPWGMTVHGMNQVVECD